MPWTPGKHPLVKTHQWRRACVALVSTLFTVACAVPYVITYDTGERRPLSEVGLVRYWRYPWREVAYVYVIQEPGTPRSGEIHYYDRSGSYVPLSPGPRVLWVTIFVPEATDKKAGRRLGPYEVRLVIEKGRVYDLAAENVGERWQPVVAEEASGRRVFP